ncbi:hypothetical protein A9264_01745 [Vibrio sp. UCD-FRSSP16_10]|uniref:hypothetical protein n=1 Tax=unclassified Vibrio TaxID=2614977 RepID=UPI0008023FD8|nr:MULTISPECIES: hypothetical protein [unclassified Vibrio]OBT13889.1 hypothetical protein A9260_03195 [Vibrio sp. UCD-FRSSP16_30]OBT22770.1 hypothetical protein A9264_01745 [Vibrio sp. UCD-FRSSP16_10]
MKKVYLALAITGLLAGCATQGNNAPATSDAANTAAPVVAVSGKNLVADPQIAEFRANKGQSDVWVKVAKKNDGLGDVGSSKVSAFASDEGSARIRFIGENDDFSATPGLTQQINVAPNTDYVFSLYFEDKKGEASPTSLLAGAMGTDGKAISEETFHVSDLGDAPRADRSTFRQVTVAFNTGSNTSVSVFAKLKVTDKSALNMGGNIGKQTEVRVDGFSLAAK